MAAYCGCCGAEITQKAEACPVCGTPRHGMVRRDEPLAADAPSSAPAAKSPLFCEWTAEMAHPQPCDPKVNA
jgi:hypothetical protein